MNSLPAYSTNDGCRDLARAFSALIENKPGVVRLRMKHGWAGYGMFCGLLNMLAEQPLLHYVNDAEIIAFKLGADAEIIRSITEDFGLFSTESQEGAEYVFSPLLRDFLVRHKPVQTDSISASTLPSAHEAAVTPAAKAPVKNDVANSAKTPSGSKGFDLEDERARLMADSTWLARIAKSADIAPELMADVFDYFADYVSTRDDISYKTEQDMTRHLLNWLMKGYGSQALKRAKIAARQRKEHAEREATRRTRAEEARHRSDRKITYDEYCRSRGIETTGSMAQDILNRLEARKHQSPG